MTGTALKIIALVTMIIDHIGAIFFPELTFIRYIGRISFPLYAFLISEGVAHTSSKQNYALRLIGFALLSEIPYDLALYGSFYYPASQNVIFELFTGMITLWSLDNALKKKKYLYLLLVPLFALLAEILGFSYGVYGIILMVVFYLLRKIPILSAIGCAAVTFIFHGITSYSLFGPGSLVSLGILSLVSVGYCNVLSLNYVQLWAMSAALFIAFYNGKEEKNRLKWMFYLIYPLHLLLLWVLNAYVF